MTKTTHDMLRSLPKIEEILRSTRVESLLERLPRPLVADLVRDTVERTRAEILAGTRGECDSETIIDDVIAHALALEHPSLRRVINASGVIVHTNLGRSVLADAAVEAVTSVARGYSTLEYNPAALARGSRHDHCEKLICALTGAEAAIAVNNNAAAVMMVLTEFAAGGEAIVSRGELVEIGGSFRVPDIMRLSNADMVEVGTTNKTHIPDYEHALTDHTAMLLKVHPSNYRMIGFTESVGLHDLHTLANRENARREQAWEHGVTDSRDTESINRDVLVYEDQGSGAFVRLACFGSYAEPTVAESLDQGADLVSFSGDKLLGGPQAGIIVGSKHLIDRLKKNPLARVLRLDKMTLAALEATLRLYLDEQCALSEIPTLRMLSEPAEAVWKRAETLMAALEQSLPPRCATVSVIPEIARAGGGALPMCDIDTYAVQVTFLRGNALDCERYLVAGRPIPIICRLKKETLLCDARTLVDPYEITEITAAFTEYFTRMDDQTTREDHIGK